MKKDRFEIQLNGNPWTVVFGNPRDGDAAACFHSSRRIVLRRDRPKHILIDDLHHEILHAETELEELAVRRIERSLRDGGKALKRHLLQNPTLLKKS